MITTGILALWISPALGGALDRDAVSFPPGYPLEPWAPALELAGLSAGGEDSAVQITEDGAIWRVEVVDRDGRVQSFSAPRPETAAQREDLVLLAASLLDPVVGLRVNWALPQPDGEPPDEGAAPARLLDAVIVTPRPAAPSGAATGAPPAPGPRSPDLSVSAIPPALDGLPRPGRGVRAWFALGGAQRVRAELAPAAGAAAGAGLAWGPALRGGVELEVHAPARVMPREAEDIGARLWQDLDAAAGLWWTGPRLTGFSAGAVAGYTRRAAIEGDAVVDVGWVPALGLEAGVGLPVGRDLFLEPRLRGRLELLTTEVALLASGDSFTLQPLALDAGLSLAYRPVTSRFRKE